MKTDKANEFIEDNKNHKVVYAAWTVNGKNIKNEPQDKWNYMRVKLENGVEFLLSNKEVKQIGSMNWGIKK